MDNLNKIYGYCIIPKNTLLFRGHNENSVSDCMFFSLKHCVAGVFNENIQVWKTTKDIQLLFLFEDLDKRSWTKSSLPQLFNLLFPEEGNPDFVALDIKHRDVTRTKKLVARLFNEYKCGGWLTSVEDKVELEVCLFNEQANEEQLVFVNTSNRNNETYFEDSLNRLNIFPAAEFYENTIRKFNIQSTSFETEREFYQRYIKTQRAWIKQEAKSDNEKTELKHFYSNLRTKLKV